MSSPDRDVSAAEHHVDVTVPPMNDTTREEKEYYMENQVLRQLIADNDVGTVLFLIFPILLPLPGLPVLIVGVWALVQGTRYFSIAILPITYVMIVSVLLIIVGMGVLLGGIAYFILLGFSGAQKRSVHTKNGCLIFSVLHALPIVVVALGTTAAALIPSLSETTQLSANTTFNNYLSDQSVQENFDNVQHNLKCCGIVAFTDYESIFNDLSVPVSCCNTSNPLANETTCPEIVSDAQQANQTSLIYSEGCVPQLQSVLQYILSVVAGVSITFGVLQILGYMPICMYLTFVSVLMIRSKFL